MSVPPRDRDVWVDELLGLDDLPPDAPTLPYGGVPYLPCGVQEIMTMVREAPLRSDDEFVDLGSGAGRVVMLAHLLSGARACGVEIQEPLVRAATARRDALGLSGVSFLHANAEAIELDGSVFFLFAPFNGAMLTNVLARLECVASRRRVIVCTVCLELRTESWLMERGRSHYELAIYDSR